MNPFDRNPFVLLGVSEDADDDAIKKAFRRLARQWHPDRNPDPSAEARMRDITDAYSKIENAQARAVWREQRTVIQMTNEDTQGFADLFGSAGVASAGAYGRLPQTGQDIRAEAHLTFEEAFHGCRRLITNKVMVLCDLCGGSAAAPGTPVYPCMTCAGTGFHRVGGVSNQCVSCSGIGITIEQPCPTCLEGLIMTEQEHLVEIPAGIEDGSELQIQGAGHPGYDKAGALRVLIRIDPSEIFERSSDGRDLFINVPVSLAEAALGAHIRIPTPQKETITISLPEATPSGKLLRIPGQGMPSWQEDEGRGDLFVRIQIKPPAELSRKQRQLLIQLMAWDDDELRRHLFPFVTIEDQTAATPTDDKPVSESDEMPPELEPID